MREFQYHSIVIKMLVVTVVGLLTSCYPSEELNVDVKDSEVELVTDLDIYIEENYREEYGMAIRYRFVDNFLDPGQVVAPVRIEVVRPMLDFIQEFWIDPYTEIPNGESFFRDHVPAEIVFLGGIIYDSNGNLILGLAEAGARIKFVDVNSIDLTNDEWKFRQLNIVYHEFAHTVHQRYKLPNAFENIAPAGYTGPGSWFVLTEEDALKRGFVTPYATSSPNEDFAETVSYYLFDPDFDSTFINLEANCVTDDCVSRNEGRLKLQDKMGAISDHYIKVTGVDLVQLRAAIQSRL